jgi:hypothetical protein
MVEGLVSKGGGVLAVHLGDLHDGGVGSMDGGGTGIDGHIEGLANSCEVGSGGHEDGKVAMGTTSSGGVDGASVGVKLMLEELQGGMGRFSGDNGKAWVLGEGERCRGGWSSAHVGISSVADGF